MNKSAIDNKVLQKLKEFETIESIEPSADWNQSLLDKIEHVNPSSSGFSSAKYTIVILFIILINIGFFLSTMFNNSQKVICRNNDLQVISKELLINPTSLNN